MDLWPRRFYVYLGGRRAPHNDVKTWVKRCNQPICALMPDRLPDPTANAVNQANFANLSRMLLDNQLVRRPLAVHVLNSERSLYSQIAMAPWGPDNLPGAGVMIYPTSSSSSLLVGAIFLSGPFPEFAVYQQSGRPNPPNPALGQASSSQYQVRFPFVSN
jgi:hypothetical protein